MEKINEVLQLKRYDAQISAILETLKEFARWAVFYFIGWVIDNGYSFFAKSKLSPEVIFAIGAIFRAADYYWHRYNKEIEPDSAGKSLGILKF